MSAVNFQIFKSRKSKTCTKHFFPNQTCIFMALAVTLHTEEITQNAADIEQLTG